MSGDAAYRVIPVVDADGDGDATEDWDWSSSSTTTVRTLGTHRAMARRAFETGVCTITLISRRRILPATTQIAFDVPTAVAPLARRTPPVPLLRLGQLPQHKAGDGSRSRNGYVPQRRVRGRGDWKGGSEGGGAGCASRRRGRGGEVMWFSYT